MTFQQLTYLLEVQRTGTITHAAENLYVTQSTMSAAINALEKELGFPVFKRGRDGVTPTPQGERVLVEAAQILDSYRNMTQAEQNGRKRYRISATSYAPFDRAFCRLIREQGANGIFSQQPVSAMEASRQLEDKTLDVAVLLTHSKNINVPENIFRERDISVEKLGRVPVQIHIGPGHRLYDAAEILPKHLDKEILVDYPHTPMLENTFLRSIFTFDRRLVILASSHAIRYQLIAQGSAYGVGAPLPEDVVRRYGLRSIPVAGVDYTVLLATNPTREQDAVIGRYIALIREELSE